MNYCYLLYIPGTNRTYIGATNDPAHRLKQHNGELAGGAKATHGKQWTQAFYVSGFPDWSTTLQFEWAWKRQARNQPGLKGKIVGLKKLLALSRPTTTAIPYICWMTPFQVHMTEAQAEVIKKIDLAEFLLATRHPLAMSAPTIASLSNQVTELAAEVAILKQRIEDVSKRLPAAESAKPAKKGGKSQKAAASAAPAEDKPKRALSPYLVFCQEKRKASTEKLSVQDLGAQWKALTAEQQAKYKPTA